MHKSFCDPDIFADLLAGALHAQTRKERAATLDRHLGAQVPVLRRPKAPRRRDWSFNDETLRLIVHTSIGGDAVRIRLSNTFSGEPVTVTCCAPGAARCGAAAFAPVPTTRSPSAVACRLMIPGGASVLSDPLPLAVPALSDVAISLYLPQGHRARRHPLQRHADIVCRGRRPDRRRRTDQRHAPSSAGLC